ncbi:HesA/MoeB/ThiF family protein [Szabonella alba]|uniref:Molybdopterin-synthase adenylyltransferase n=1 Tax=Szabonella alba TaxID=2804194 RepID=A0A8K0XZQ1_9RHOB|nr:HesA/MoeB/ThiF family protein [Szabonella alba]MBL4916022.1 HesA/MoeB/ThiF family protein [Szabonella alba]
MIGLLGFGVIWALARWRPGLVPGLPLALIWWGMLLLVHAPLIAQPNPVAGFLGGDFRAWLLFGALLALILAYRRGLAALHRRAAGAAAQAGTDKAPSAVNAVPAFTAPAFTATELERYSRHIMLREIGGTGQKRLKSARVLVVGAGGLGSPVLLYLAAAGVGRITVIDPDRVENSNLQRQVIHRDDSLGQPKVQSAADAMRALNPFVEIVTHIGRLDEDSRDLLDGQDLILDGTDNFDTRYGVNRWAVAAGKPLISGAITQWEGQIGLYDPARGGPCYECVFPTRPAPGLVPTCAEAGVAGPLPGVIGAMMALEAVKHLTGAGQGLRGRLMIHDALYAETRMIGTRPRADCPVCAGRGVV